MLAGLLISSQSFVMAQNTPADIPPANEYRQLSCNQLGRLMYAVNELAWQGKTVEEIYIALTPADALISVRDWHAAMIPNYVTKQPQGVEPEFALQTLAAGVIQECSKEGVLEELTELLEGRCDQFVGWVPRVVAMREQGRSAQEFVDRLSSAMRGISSGSVYTGWQQMPTRQSSSISSITTPTKPRSNWRK